MWTGGEGGVNDAGTDRASNGGDSGAAIFSLNGSLTLENAAISDNFATGAGGGVVVVAFPLVRGVPAVASFRLFNTIISRNGAEECILESTSDPTGGNNVGTIDAKGSGNLILDNNRCPGVAVTTDPHLAALAVDKHSKTGTLPWRCQQTALRSTPAMMTMSWQQISGELHVRKARTLTLEPSNSLLRLRIWL
jgi:hypothetical protein